MPSSSAERCRRYREKLKLTNPEKYEMLKKKNAERTKANKKKISDMSQEEKNLARKQWRDTKRRKKVKCEPSSDHDQYDHAETGHKLQCENKLLKEKNRQLCLKNASLQKSLLRYKKNKIKLCNELDTLRQLNEEMSKHDLTPDYIPKLINREILGICDQSNELSRLLVTQHTKGTLRSSPIVTCSIYGESCNNVTTTSIVNGSVVTTYGQPVTLEHVTSDPLIVKTETIDEDQLLVSISESDSDN